MQEFGREERVGAEIQRELALLIRDEINDPRIVNPTIQEVRVVRDLSRAKVNALAHLSCWNVTENAARIRQFFGI